MMANPLGWFEVSNLPRQFFDQVAPLVAAWKRERAAMQAGHIFPIGAAPDGFAWTGFASVSDNNREGYVLVFRERNTAAAWSLESPVFASGEYKLELLAGEGSGTLRIKASNHNSWSTRIRLVPRPAGPTLDLNHFLPGEILRAKTHFCIVADGVASISDTCFALMSPFMAARRSTIVLGSTRVDTHHPAWVVINQQRKWDQKTSLRRSGPVCSGVAAELWLNSLGDVRYNFAYRRLSAATNPRPSKAAWILSEMGFKLLESARREGS